MHVFFIVMVVLGMVVWTVFSVVGIVVVWKSPLSNWPIVGLLMILFGGLGFFVQGLSAAGGLNWLPRSFEWPVGYATDVARTSSGGYVVPHRSSGRVQVYDAELEFVRGWPVDASAGHFDVAVDDDDRIHVMTARGDQHFTFDLQGRQLGQETFDPYSPPYAAQGESLLVPTFPLFWIVTHPFIAWGVAALGMAWLAVRARRQAKGWPDASETA